MNQNPSIDAALASNALSALTMLFNGVVAAYHAEVQALRSRELAYQAQIAALSKQNLTLKEENERLGKRVAVAEESGITRKNGKEKPKAKDAGQGTPPGHSDGQTPQSPTRGG